MKRLVILLLGFLVCLIASAGFAQTGAKELVVFAGAGLREPLDEIGKRFEEQHGVKVIYDYEGSGTLSNKMLLGQVPDVFIPGSDKWVRLLKEKGLIKDFTPVAYHTPVIITLKENNTIRSIKDFTHPDHRLVLGDAKATAIGDASSIIFQKAGLLESKMNIKARGLTVKQLLLWVEENNADASIVWKTDALQSPKVRVIEIPKDYNYINLIPVCRMMKDNERAQAYLQYVLSAEGKAIFTKYGFEVMK